MGKLIEPNSALAAASREVKKILAVRDGVERTKANTLEPWNRVAAVISDARNHASLYEAVHPDAKVRASAERAVQVISKFIAELYLRADLYQAIKKVSTKNLDEQAKRFLEKELKDFELSGINKSSSDKWRIKQLLNREIKLGQAFARNIKDDV